MSYECVCDYDPPTLYTCTPVKAARKEHQCEECRRTIKPGESYELVFGMWDGRADTFKTCSHCLALREWVKAHVPCFCWAHGHIREDAIETAQGYAHEAPGLLFGAYRREIAIKRAPRGATEDDMKHNSTPGVAVDVCPHCKAEVGEHHNCPVAGPVWTPRELAAAKERAAGMAAWMGITCGVDLPDGAKHG